MKHATESNDTRLILEALHVLLQLHDELGPITEKIENRLARPQSQRAPTASRVWHPTIEGFTAHTAVLFCNRRTAKGFTRDNLAKHGIPWPPPARWKRRLRDVLADPSSW